MAEHAVVEMETSLTLEKRLDKQRWYIGEVTQEVAASLLSSGQPHSFVVFAQPDTRLYILSARFPLKGLEGGVIEHLAICCEGGKCCITGQTDVYDDVIEAVNCYVLTFDPPLMPALQGKSFETQISITTAPPEYEKANRVLKPDIAPLPDITEVKVADKKAIEAQSGRISSTTRSGRISPTDRRGSDDNSTPIYYNNRGRRRPSYMDRSIWLRSSEHHRCHPKNVCSGCCYRPEEWLGDSVHHNRKWYDPQGSGPLRVLALLLFWLFCFPCLGCYMCHTKCLVIRMIWFCCSLCYDLDDWGNDSDGSDDS